MSKIAVFFPGMGYTAHKPLLHYAQMLAKSEGYTTVALSYSGFPEKKIGDATVMHRSYDIALAQTNEQLASIDFASYDEVLFVGKSIGTIVAATLASTPELKDKTKLVLYTPLDETFAFSFGPAIAFTGTADQWVGKADNRIPALCQQHNIPCYLTKHANHSLETGDALRDIKNLKKIMQRTQDFLSSSSK